MLFDGVTATLNKPGWVSFQIVVYETTSGSAVDVPGSWTYYSPSSTLIFYPSVAPQKWAVGFTINGAIFDVSQTNNVATCIGNTLWDSNNLSASLWKSWQIRNRDNSSGVVGYVDDLSGRSIRVDFVIKANTDAAPTF